MSMHKCHSAICSKFIETEVQSYVKIDRADEVQVFCDAKCFKEYERQDQLFIELANPFRDRPPKVYR